MTDPVHLPRIAQRLLSLSLPPAERPAVLGDLHEEIFDLAARTSVDHARRWYWRQALRSVGPNLWRWLAANTRNQAPAALLRAFGLFVVLGIGLTLPAFALWALFGYLWDPFPYGPLFMVAYVVAKAALMLAVTFVARLFWPRFGRRAPTQVETAVLVALVLFAIATKRSMTAVAHVEILALILLACVAIEIRHAWQARRAPRFYDVRVSALGTYNDRDFGAFGAITMAVDGLALSRPIIGRAVTVPIADEFAAADVTPMRITIDRAFSSAETLRVVAALRRKSAVARAIVDIVDSDGAIKQQIPAVVSSTLSRPIDIEPLGSDPRFAEISAAIPLAGFVPGDYRLRISALDGGGAVTQEERITVRPTVPGAPGSDRRSRRDARADSTPAE